MFRKTLVFILAALCAAATVCAQSVGVVFSGGGAKGLYHIGVLQALEENEIPVDYIAGTSMGAIIAGLYAAGYSPDEMKAIVASGEVERWATGKIDASHRHFYRQMLELPSAVTLRLNLKSRRQGEKVLQMPGNLISSASIDLALVGLFQPATVASNGDFDSLMVPFRCLASDMNARRGTVFKNGDLGKAIRASMSLPLVFKPVEIDSMLLYDGGLFDNFPWRSLEEDFHPDFYIGSKCTSGNTPVNNESNIVDQALMLMTTNTDYSLPEGRGVMIDRAVDAGMLDFAKGEMIIRQGYEDAMAAMPQIREAVKSRRTVEEVERRRAEFRSRSPQLIFDNYEIKGLRRSQRAFVADMMQLYDKSDRPRELSFDELRDRVYDLLAENDFVADYPSVTYSAGSGRYTAGLNLQARPSFKISFGGNVSSTAFNQALISLRYETIGRVAQQAFLDLYLGTICNVGRLGGRTTFFQRYPMFIDYSYNFGVMNTLHGNFGNLTRVDNSWNIKSKENFGSMGVGVALTKKSVLRAVVHGGETTYRMSDWEDPTRFVFVGAMLELQRNTLDVPLFPTRGTNLTVSGIYIFGQDKYRRNPLTDEPTGEKQQRKQWPGARVTWEQYFRFPAVKWFSLGYEVDGVFTAHPRFESPETTVMSSPLYAPIPHSNMICMPDFRAAKFVAAGVMPTFNIIDNLMVRAGFYAMFRDKMYTDSNWHYIADLSVVYHTAVGPVSLALTKYDLDNWNNTYLTFNFGMLIFSPKGLFY